MKLLIKKIYEKAKETIFCNKNLTRVMLTTLAIALPFIFPETASADSIASLYSGNAHHFVFKTGLWIAEIFGIIFNIAFISVYWKKHKKILISLYTTVVMFSFLFVYLTSSQGFSLLYFITICLIMLCAIGILGLPMAMSDEEQARKGRA